MKKWNTLTQNFISSKRARLDKKTIDWYSAKLKTWGAFASKRGRKPKQITVADLDQFFGELKAANLKYNTRKGQLVATKAFFKWLRKHRHIKQNPFDEFEPLPKERDSIVEPIPLSYAYRMIRAAESDVSPYGPRDAAIMRMLLTTGARREEVSALQMSQINLDTGTVIFDGKYGHRRVVPLRATLVSALERWLTRRPFTESSAVFVSLHPNKKQMYAGLRPDAINDILIKWRDAAGLPAVSVSPHKWRHRFASALKKAGDPFSMQMLLGHSDISTTQRYVHASPEELAAIIFRFGPDTPD